MTLWQEIRLARAARDLIAKGKQIDMKFSWHMVAQLAAIGIQGANSAGGILPQYQFEITLAVSALQLLMGAIAHFSTPPGAVAVTPTIQP